MICLGPAQAGHLRWLIPLLAIALVPAAAACAGGGETRGPLPTAVPPPALEGWEIQAFQIPGTRDLISVPVGWSVAGPDTVGSVSFSEGDESTYGAVTIIFDDSPRGSLSGFSDDLMRARAKAHGTLTTPAVAKTDLGGAQAREFRYRHETASGQAEALELHLLDDGRGITVAGEWGPEAAGVVERLVAGTAYSFRPGAADAPCEEAPPASKVPYPGAGTGRSVQRSVALGSYLALDDSSLWEIAVAQRLAVLQWETDDPILIESQEDGAAFPYTIVNDRCGERVSARYVGRAGTP